MVGLGSLDLNVNNTLPYGNFDLGDKYSVV
jgi:hypothetical protein